MQFYFIAKFRRKIKKIIRFVKDLIILSLPIYHTDLNKICLKQWFDIINGDMKSLYKFKFFTHIPYKFENIISDMMFQLDYLDISIINKNAELAILRSIAARTKNKTMDFQADVLENAIKSKVNSGKNAEPIKLNEFIDYIEDPIEDFAFLETIHEETKLSFAFDEQLKKGNFKKEKYLKAWVIKPSLWGGISKSIQMIDLAKEQKVLAVISSAYETKITLKNLAALASYQNQFQKTDCGLNTFENFIDDDSLENPILKKGNLRFS